eukprot:scpid51095/ scgid31348/ 
MGNCLSKRHGSLTLDHTASASSPTASGMVDTGTAAAAGGDNDTGTGGRDSNSPRPKHSPSTSASSSSCNVGATTGTGSVEGEGPGAQDSGGHGMTSAGVCVERTHATNPECQQPRSDQGNCKEYDVDTPLVADSSDMNVMKTEDESKDQAVTLIEIAKGAKHEENGYKQAELFPAHSESAPTALSEDTEDTLNDEAAATVAEVVSGGAGNIPLLIVTDASNTSTTNTESSENENHSRSLSLTNQFHDSLQEAEANGTEDDIEPCNSCEPPDMTHHVEQPAEELGNQNGNAEAAVEDHAQAALQQSESPVASDPGQVDIPVPDTALAAVDDACSGDVDLGEVREAVTSTPAHCQSPSPEAMDLIPATNSEISDDW